MKGGPAKHGTGLVIAEPTPANWSSELMIVGNLALRSGDSRAYWKEVDLDLTLGEYNVLHLLASNRGLYQTYRAIYDRMHYAGFMAGSGPDGYRQNVRSVIKRIRNKCRAVDPTFDDIETYVGFGYRWKE